MPWRSSFPCHRMCCGPDTLLWFALSVFRVADMIGTDGHVSFLPQKQKTKKIFCPGPDGHLTHRYTASSTAALLAVEQLLYNLCWARTCQQASGRCWSSSGTPRGLGIPGTQPASNRCQLWALTLSEHGLYFYFFLVEESLHVHRCQSCQQPERQIKQTTEECRVHSTSFDKGSCFAMA